jgi:Uma2 family endonuclease
MTMIDPPAIAPAPDAPGSMSFEEFLIHYDGVHAEWLPDGRVEMVMSNNLTHNDLLGLLYYLLRMYLAFTGQGKVLLAGFPMRPDTQGSAREPDLLVLLPAHFDRLRETFLDGAPDIAIEIVSPESTSRDYGVKFVEYEAAGIPEYWLFDPRRRLAVFYTLEEQDGERVYRTRPLDERQRLTSGVLPGFTLDPALLWMQPLPDGEALLALVAELIGRPIRIDP